MKEAISEYVKRVRDLESHVRGNEQATKQSLIGPLFTLLGYDLTDPRQCVPEYKVDFGKERSTKPIDWAFFNNGKPIFFVEAKEVGKKLPAYDEQLADYFAKAPEVKLGILTNGIHWRFFTDLVNQNVMDKEPFVKWDVLSNEPPPIDFLAVLQRSEYNAGLVRTYAQRTLQHNLLLAELTRLLEPSTEFTKLAIANIETRNLTSVVVDSWKPIVASAINHWARQKALSSVMSSAHAEPAGAAPVEPTKEAKAPKAPRERKIETTAEELSAFATIQALLGKERPVAYEDTASYFKIHLPEKKSATVCRLFMRKKGLVMVVPLPAERVAILGQVQGAPRGEGWSTITLEAHAELSKLAEIVRAAWDAQRSGRVKVDEVEVELD